ncbi:MAG: caspase family protein [Bacteroidota bacterium]
MSKSPNTQPVSPSSSEESSGHPSTVDQLLPDTARDQSNSKHVRLFALLIGINYYEGKVRNLKGCVKDVNTIVEYLSVHPHFGKGIPKGDNLIPIRNSESVNKSYEGEFLKLKILTNAEASYENIMEAFGQHMLNQNANSGDSFWLHFSGHGTEQHTAEAFIRPKDPEGNPLPSLVPDGKDQTLLCYNPAGTLKGVLLADKELAAMISEIHATVPRKGIDHPHILVTLDCCHSGSGTRNLKESELTTRSHDWIGSMTREDAAQFGKVRSLNSYYRKNGESKGYYQRLHEQGKLDIPTSKHLLISACTNLEEAGDLSHGGIFTQSIISRLTAGMNAGQCMNYLDLFRQARVQSIAEAKIRRHIQTPQFETIGGFNAYSAVLEGWALGKPGRYELLKKGRLWYVRCGAIHGLPIRSAEKVAIRIFKVKGNEHVGDAVIRKVGMQDSRLDLSILWRKNVNGKDESEEAYVGEIVSLPAEPKYIWIHRDEEAATDSTAVNKSIIDLTDGWQKKLDADDLELENLSIYLTTEKDKEETPEVEIFVDEKGTFILKDFMEQQAWISIPHIGDASLMVVKANIEKIIRWKRLFALNNKRSKLRSSCRMDVMTMDYLQWEKADCPDIFEEKEKVIQGMKVHDSKEIHLFVNEENLIRHGNDMDLNTNEKDAVLSYIRLHCNQKNVYVYLYDFNSDCSIVPITDFRLENPTKKEGVQLRTLSPLLLEIDEYKKIFRYKLLIAKEEIDKDVLTQDGIKSTRYSRESTGVKRASATDDWYCINVTITLERKK